MKKLLLILAAVTAGYSAVAEGVFWGDVTPSCDVIKSSPYGSLSYEPGQLDMKQNQCIQITEWSPGPVASASGPWNFIHKATLVFQYDGNVVLYSYDSYYEATDVRALNIDNKGGDKFIYQLDNNLVVYSNNFPVWAASSDHNKYDTFFLEFNENNRYADATVKLAKKESKDGMTILHAEPTYTPH